jgi:sortase A
VPIDQHIPPIVAGRAIAKLEIPKIGKVDDSALYVLPGVDFETLHDGPGHYPDTPLPGQLGNAAIAGHRTTSGAPFANIDELEPGDEIIVTMLSGDRFVYAVSDTLIVEPSDYWVVGTTDPSVAQLTLTSCHPRFEASKRIVVRSVLVPDDSAPVGKPTFYELEDGGSTSEPASPPTPIVDGGPGPVTTAPSPGTDEPDTTDSDTTDTDITDGDITDGRVSGPEALTDGWFHDPDAWPHIAAWGAVCLLTAYVAYRISRRFRSYAIGWGICAVPFLLVLYFLYQNVNRLLPPGL